MPSLRELADNMFERVCTDGQATVTLSRGLTLSLSEDEIREWQLELRRKNVAPSAIEIQLIREAFRVPTDAVVSQADFSVTLTWQDEEDEE